MTKEEKQIAEKILSSFEDYCMKLDYDVWWLESVAELFLQRIEEGEIESPFT